MRVQNFSSNYSLTRQEWVRSLAVSIEEHSREGMVVVLGIMEAGNGSIVQEMVRVGGHMHILLLRRVPAKILL